MKVYLIQHGDSLEKEINELRPLSETGKKDIEKMANFLTPAKLTVGNIFHSGKLRAEQTAEIIKKAFHYNKKTQMKSGLEPMDPVDPIAKEINDFSADMILVGHLPFMAKLAGKLISDDENKLTVAFQPGSMVCLQKNENNPNLWVVRWMLRPELFV